MNRLAEGEHYLLQTGSWVLELAASLDINTGCWKLNEVDGRLQILVKPDGKLIPEIADESLESFAREFAIANYTTSDLKLKKEST